MTKDQRLKAFLNEFLPFVNSKVPTLINMGGSAMFALHLSDALDNMHVPHTIEAIIFKAGGSEFAEMQVSNLMKLINTGSGSFNLSESHVVVSVGGGIFDSEGSLCDPDGSFRATVPKISHFITLPKSVLLEQIKEVKWNSIFDKTQDVLIKHLLHKMGRDFHQWYPGAYGKTDLERKVLNHYTRQELIKHSRDFPAMAVIAARGEPATEYMEV